MEGFKRSDLDTGIYQNADVLNIYFSGFRLPAFFIVAGVMAAFSLQRKTAPSFLNHRAAVILYPYLLWGSVQLAIQLLFPQWVNAKRSVSDFGHLFYLPRTIDQFWYLYAVFNISVVFVILFRVVKIPAIYQLLIGVVFYMLNAYLKNHQIEAGFLADILHYYLFFAIGAFSSAFLLNPKNAGLLSSNKLLIWSLVFFLFCQGVFLFAVPVRDASYFDYFTTHYPAYFFIMAISGAAFLIAVSFWLSRMHRLGLIRKIGTYSLYIFLWHVFFIAAARIGLVKWLHIKNIHILVFVGMAAGLALPIVLYRLASRHSWRWLYRAPLLFGSKRNTTSVQYAKV